VLGALKIQATTTIFRKSSEMGASRHQPSTINHEILLVAFQFSSLIRISIVNSSNWKTEMPLEGFHG
jgi:hypothetical protein